MAHNSRFVHTRIIWQAVYQAKPGSPICVINTRTVSQSIRDSGKLDIAKDYTFPIKRNETKRNVSVVCKIQILRQKLHIHNKSGDASIALCAPLCQGQGGDPFLLLTLYSLHLYLHLYFYLHLYSYCICNCIKYVFVGCAKVREAFLVLLLTLYSYNLRLLLLFPASLLGKLSFTF